MKKLETNQTGIFSQQIFKSQQIPVVYFSQQLNPCFCCVENKELMKITHQCHP